MPPSDPGDLASPALLRELIAAYPFPDASAADSSGMLAYGGDLCAERLLAAYAQGVFPWYESDPILWFSPDPRQVLLPEELRVSHSLGRAVRREPFELRLDEGFEAVIRGCAQVPRPGQSGTWITADMIDAYCRLYELGFAHCVSAWEGESLMGGLYGISLGAAFFGESMFSRRSDASKLATVRLVRQLHEWGFRFVDCQVHSEHLARFGAREWPRPRFLRELATALEQETLRGPWRWSEPSAPEAP